MKRDGSARLIWPGGGAIRACFMPRRRIRGRISRWALPLPCAVRQDAASGDVGTATALAQLRRQRSYGVSAATALAKPRRAGTARALAAPYRPKQRPNKNSPCPLPDKGCFSCCAVSFDAAIRSSVHQDAAPHTEGAPCLLLQMHRQSAHSALLKSGADLPAFPRTAPPTAKE